MLKKYVAILKFMELHRRIYLRPCTIGEVSKGTGLPKSTVRRYVFNLVELGHVRTDFEDYKKSGKNVFWIAVTGLEIVDSAKELF